MDERISVGNAWELSEARESESENKWRSMISCWRDAGVEGWLVRDDGAGGAGGADGAGGAGSVNTLSNPANGWEIK